MASTVVRGRRASALLFRSWVAQPLRVRHGAACGCPACSGARGLAARAGGIEAIKRLREQTGAPVTEVKSALEASGWDVEKAHVELRKRGIAAAEKKRAKRTAAEGLVALAAAEDGRAAALAEVNCETDFVARNDAFQALALDTAKAVLAAAREGDSPADQIVGLPSPSDPAKPLSSVLEDVSIVVRERVDIRRSIHLSVDEGVVGSYIHVSPAPGLGAIGSLVCLSSDSPLDSSARDRLAAVGKKLAMHVVAASPRYASREAVPESAVAAETDVLMSQPGVGDKPRDIVDKMIKGKLAKFFKQVTLLEQPFVMDDSRTVEQVVREASKDVGAQISLTHFTRLQVGEGIEREQADFAKEVAEAAKMS